MEAGAFFGRRLIGSVAPGLLVVQGEVPPMRLGISGPVADWSVSKAHRKLLLGRFCQQAAQCSSIDDVEA